MDNDFVYLDRRASEERCAASKSPHPGARGIHLELAQAYEFRLQLLKQVQANKPAPVQFETRETRTVVLPRRTSARTFRSEGDAMRQDIIPVQI